MNLHQKDTHSLKLQFLVSPLNLLVSTSFWFRVNRRHTGRTDGRGATLYLAP